MGILFEEIMINWLLENDFILKAGLAGISISIIAGPLGSIMIWRRLAYFGDALAHSTLLGLALATMLNANAYFGLIGICLLVSAVLLNLSKNSQFTNDAILSILSNTILAVGLIAVTKVENLRLDVLGCFYGDILSVELPDIYWILGVSLFALIVLIKLWRWLLLITLHEDLAHVEGVPVEKVKWLFVLVMALVFAVTMRLLGMLLIVALFVIPAASARRWAKTPEAMAVLGSVFSGIAVILGVLLSAHYDWPTGPAIVVVAASIFILSLVKR